VCELKVRLNRAQADEQVAEDVIYARNEPSHVLLKDVLGTTRTVPAALISTIDIGNESLLLTQSSVIPPFLRFLEVFQKAESSQSYGLVEERWNELKAAGDEAVRALWRKYGRSP